MASGVDWGARTVSVGIIFGAAGEIGSEVEPPPQPLRKIAKIKTATRLYRDQCAVKYLGTIITVSSTVSSIVLKRGYLNHERYVPASGRFQN